MPFLALAVYILMICAIYQASPILAGFMVIGLMGGILVMPAQLRWEAKHRR